MKKNKIEDFNEILRGNKFSIVCAESITAGLLSSTIASVSGASDILKGSIVTYSRELKTSILDVNPRIIDKHTAESIETTVEMVYGLTKIYPSADIFVAVTGVASESPKVKKEVGQVYIAVYHKNKIYEIGKIIKVEDDDRRKIQEGTVDFILQIILEILPLDPNKEYVYDQAGKFRQIP